jgi:hypothetical protein
MKGKKPAPTTPSAKKKAASTTRAAAPPPSKPGTAKTAQRPPGKKSATRKARPVPRTLAGMGREAPVPRPAPAFDPPLEETVVIDSLPHSSRPVQTPSSDAIDVATMELPAVKAAKAAPSDETMPPMSRRAAVIAESAKNLADEVEDLGDLEEIEDVEATIAFPRRDPSIAAPPPAVVAQIRELEAQLDRLIDEASRRDLSALAPESDEGQFSWHR